jgi:hypothetical protein
VELNIFARKNGQKVFIDQYPSKRSSEVMPGTPLLGTKLYQQPKYTLTAEVCKIEQLVQSICARLVISGAVQYDTLREYLDQLTDLRELDLAAYLDEVQDLMAAIFAAVERRPA